MPPPPTQPPAPPRSAHMPPPPTQAPPRSAGIQPLPMQAPFPAPAARAQMPTLPPQSTWPSNAPPQAPPAQAAQAAVPSGEAGAQAAPTKRGSKVLHLFLLALFATGTFALAIRGWEFYALDLSSRVDHPDFRQLSPSSSYGQAYGIAATVLFLTNLAYLLRRRFARLSVGSLRAWLDVHVFTGLFGGMLVVFHSAFQARSTASLVTLISMAVVLGTGLVGRYLYGLSPKADSKGFLAALSELDRQFPGMGARLRKQLSEASLTQPPARPSLFASALRLPRWRREARLRSDIVDHAIEHVTQFFPAEAARCEGALKLCRREARSQVWAVASLALLDSWRGVHRLSALLMVLVVGLHIGIAWYYGFATLFSGAG